MLGRIKTILPDKVSAGEITAGNETEVRSYSPEDIVSFIAQHGSEGIDWSQTQLSEVIDAVSEIGFSFDTDNPLSLGRIFDIKNGGSDYLYGEQYKLVLDGQYGVMELESYRLNTTHGNLQLAVGGATMFLASASSVVIGANSTPDIFLHWDLSGTKTISPQNTFTPTSLSLRSADAQGDSLAATTVIRGGNAFASASTNIDGGDMQIGGGAEASGGTEGKIVPTTGFRSDVTDSASAVAYEFDAANSMALGKVFSWTSGGVERLSLNNAELAFTDQYNTMKMRGWGLQTGWQNFQLGCNNAIQLRLNQDEIFFGDGSQVDTFTFRYNGSGATAVTTVAGEDASLPNHFLLRPGNCTTGDFRAPELRLKAGTPGASATGTNQNGADLLLEGGDSVGSGSKGGVKITNHIILGDDRTTNHNIVLSGLLETNKDAAGAVNWTLPTDAPRGFHGELRRVEDQDVSLVAPSGVEMVYDGTLLATGSTITLTHGYKGLSYKAVSSTLWLVDTVTNVRTGFVDYNHDAAAINLVADTWTDVPNNGAGLFTNETFSPVTDSLLDTGTGYLDFTELPLGSEVLIRSDFSVNPQVNNSLLEARYVLGTGAGEYALQFLSERLDNGSGIDYSRVLPFPIYMGDTNTRDNPGKLQVKLSTTGTLQNNGFYISIRGN